MRRDFFIGTDMKICIFTNHFYPEDFKVNDIAFELGKLGHDVTVLTAIPDYPKGKFYDGYSLFKRRREYVNGVNVIRLPIIPRGKGGAIRLVLNYLSYFISLSIFTFFHSFKHKYDRIFVHLTSPFFIGVCARKMSKRQKIPLLFWVLDLWPESLISAGGISNPLIIKPQIRMVQKVYDQCSKILISSKGFEKSICEKGNYKDKLVYFPNWAENVKGECPADFDINKIEPFASKKDDDFILLFAGNIGEAQNLDAVLNAANLLKDEKRIKFVFVGDGRRKETLEQFARENKLCDTVFFLGRYPITTMPVFMNAADVLMFSLKDELCFNLTVPAKVQFYMSQGKPVLAMINGDGAELVEESKCGFSANAGNSEDFAKKVILLSNMPKGELQALGENGRNYYQEKFTKLQHITQLNDLLNFGVN